MRISEMELKRIAENNPQELIKLLSDNNADIATLTFGAEMIGSIKDENLVTPILKKLLSHINAVVREGAVYGTSAFFDNKSLPEDILNKIKAMSIKDPSPGVRQCSKDLLTVFGECK